MTNATNSASRRTAVRQVLTATVLRRDSDGPRRRVSTVLRTADHGLVCDDPPSRSSRILHAMVDRRRVPGGPFVAWTMLAYAGLIGFEFVFSRERYMLDVMGAATFALAIAQLSRVPFLACGKRVVAWVKACWTFVPRLRPSGFESGQALIEFALILPVMLGFLLVLFDFGLALDHREVIQHAVREGARQGAVCNDSADNCVKLITDETVAQSLDVLTPQDPSANCQPNAEICVCYVAANGGSSVGNPGDDVRVSVNYTYNFSVGSGELLSALKIPRPRIPMNPRAEARLETSVTGATACK